MRYGRVRGKQRWTSETDGWRGEAGTRRANDRDGHGSLTSLSFRVKRWGESGDAAYVRTYVKSNGALLKSGGRNEPRRIVRPPYLVVLVGTSFSQSTELPLLAKESRQL